MKRGRPTKSQVRQNMIEILFFLKKAHGYRIFQVYRELFPKVTMRSIYYHLKKGEALQEFQMEQEALEQGNYSWGDAAKKLYYRLGPKAKPEVNARVKKYLEQHGLLKI
ncbi:hypothetical protein J4475_00840 [Candidatus Woesearchaeota archaeon]|nr:hypothetical protein [Candidatus Woesearchaeota archaeon]